MKKYKLTDETIQVDGRTLYMIQALRDFTTASGEACISGHDKLS